jgi:hypothetical protein
VLCSCTPERGCCALLVLCASAAGHFGAAATRRWPRRRSRPIWYPFPLIPIHPCFHPPLAQSRSSSLSPHVRSPPQDVDFGVDQSFILLRDTTPPDIQVPPGGSGKKFGILIHMHTRTHTLTRTHARTHARTHTHTHVYIYILSCRPMQVCVCVYTHTHTHVYIYILSCRPVQVCVCVYICKCVCVCVHIYIYIQVVLQACASVWRRRRTHTQTTPMDPTSRGPT